MRKRVGFAMRFGVLAAMLATSARGGGFPDCDQNQVQIPFSGTVDAFVVPAGVDQMTAIVAGAAGGNGDSSNVGGTGAEVVVTFPVTAGETLSLIVASQGEAAGAQTFCGGGGGGASVIARAGFVPVVVAGGGGGGGSYGPSGATADASLTATGNPGEGSDGGAAGAGTNGGDAASGAGGGGVGTAGGSNPGGATGGAALSGTAAGGPAGFGGADGGFGGGGASGGTEPPLVPNGGGCAGGGGGGGYAGGGGGGADDGANAAGGGGGTFVAPEASVILGPQLSGGLAGDIRLCWAVNESVLEVPTASGWGLAFLALGLAVAATVAVRRRVA
jgi:hypothetical protein